MENIIKYHLDNTVIEFESVIKKYELSKFYPQSSHVLENITQIKTGGNTHFKGNKNYFLHEITTGIKNDYYKMAWNIDDIKEFLKNMNWQAKQILLTELHWDKNELIQSKLEKLRKLEIHKHPPIIFVEYPMVHKKIVIDGTHRCKVSHENGLTSINAIQIPFESLYNFIFSELHKQLFTFHYNFYCFMYYRGNFPEHLPVLFNGTLNYLKRKKKIPILNWWY